MNSRPNLNRKNSKNEITRLYTYTTQTTTKNDRNLPKVFRPHGLLGTGAVVDQADAAGVVSDGIGAPQSLWGGLAAPVTATLFPPSLLSLLSAALSMGCGPQVPPENNDPVPKILKDDGGGGLAPVDP